MKFSINLAQKYSNVDIKDLSPDDIVQRIGAQLGAVESVTDYRQRYHGIVVVKVVSCDQHPDADKLSLCLVDDGGATEYVDRNDAGFVQVVCGAPNVKAGMLAAWIPPGATVPNSYEDAEPFVLGARELRGKMSNGMLASPKELAISDEHDGIVDIISEEFDRESPIEPGESVAQLYGLDDVIIDCENKMFTHRPDCFGNIGIAREIAGIFGMRHKSPEWYTQLPEFETSERLPIKVVNDAPGLAPRFMNVVLDGVDIKPSPVWMQSILTKVGIKPINNVVDVTNYVMHVTGQPLHAFDYEKLADLSNGDPTLMVRMAENGEKISLLNGKTYELSNKDIVLATDRSPVDVAGIMGGSETEIRKDTKSVVLSCANFDMYAIRKTSMQYGLFTDAVTRFNKGQSPLQNDKVLAYAMSLLKRYASAQQASDVADPTEIDLAIDNLSRVTTTAEFINSRLGSNLDDSQIKQLLENVEFTVDVEGEQLHVIAPFWRMDIAIGEDIVEEVGRLHGYQNIPATLPMRSSKPAPLNQALEFKQSLRDSLATAGGREVLTYSFVHGDLMTKTGSDPEKWALHIRNALSPDLQYYRTSLLPSLLQKVRGNVKAGAGADDNEFALFEIGKVHVKSHNEQPPEDTLPKQMRRLAMVIAADDKTSKDRGGSAYYQAKKYVDMITGGQAVYSPLETNDYPLTAPYQMGKSAVISLAADQPPIGVIGEFRSKVKKALKLPEYCAGFEIDTDYLMAEVTPKKYKVTSNYPATNQDITFEIPGSTSWGELYKLLDAELKIAHVESGYESTIEPLGIYQADDSEKKRVSLRIELSHSGKTLKTTDVNELLEQIAKAAEKLDAIRI